MGLIKCPDCGGKVSDSASMCIHCGRPFEDNFNTNFIKIRTIKDECEIINKKIDDVINSKLKKPLIPLIGYSW